MLGRELICEKWLVNLKVLQIMRVGVVGGGGLEWKGVVESAGWRL